MSSYRVLIFIGIKIMLALSSNQVSNANNNNIECNLLVNNQNYTERNIIYLNSEKNSINLTYLMPNDKYFIEAYIITIICNYNYDTTNHQVINSNKNIQTIRGLVKLRNCSEDDALNLNLPNLNDNYNYMTFLSEFDLFKANITRSFEKSYIIVMSKMISYSKTCYKNFMLKVSTGSGLSRILNIINHFIVKLKSFEPTYIIILCLIVFTFVIISSLIMYFAYLCCCKRKNKNFFHISNTLTRLVNKTLSRKRSRKQKRLDKLDYIENNVINESVNTESKAIDETDLDYNSNHLLEHKDNLKFIKKNKLNNRNLNKAHKNNKNNAVTHDKRKTNKKSSVIENDFILKGKNYNTIHEDNDNFDAFFSNFNTSNANSVKDSSHKNRSNTDNNSQNDGRINMRFVPNVIFELKQVPSTNFN